LVPTMRYAPTSAALKLVTKVATRSSPNRSVAAVVSSIPARLFSPLLIDTAETSVGSARNRFRAALMQFAGPYVAYMLLTNWTSVLLLGFYCGSRQPAPERHAPVAAAGFATLLAVLLAGSAAIFWNLLQTVPTFPLMTIAPGSGWGAALIVAAGTSWCYFVTTLLVFAVARRLPAPALAKFIARNSLIVFLVHMPVYFALSPVLTGLGLGYWPRALVQFVICLFGLALFSEAIRAVLPAWPAHRRVSLGLVHESR